MNVKEYKSFTVEEKTEFFRYLSHIDTKKPATVNMYDTNYENKPNTLPYILNNTNRFVGDNGNYYILYDKENIVACGGVYKSDFDENIIIAGSRTYVDVNYRNRSILRDYILTEHKKWAIENNGKIILLCFNEYNKNVIEVFKRRRLGETLDRINTRTSEHLFYNGLNELDYPVNIQYTKQYIIYEKLSDYDYDWNNIKWV